MWWKSRIEKEVDAYIVKYQMDKYIYRSPFRTDVPDLLNSINVYCLPSLWEGLSIALLEAMAMGKAIVATPTDGTKEVIEDGKNGVVIPFEQPQALSDAIIRLHDDNVLFQQCGVEASRVVAWRFNAQRVADAVAAIYEKHITL